MNLFGVDNWLKTPADRDIIRRWTMGKAEAEAEGTDLTGWYRLELPGALPPATAIPPGEQASWEFLVLGDTGDLDASGPELSPQDAVGQQMARDAALPNKPGKASLVVHTGDVIYMTGERRLYDRNFRRPYHEFLIPESTVDNLIFRLPFLPVPGNHDYYDLGSWARFISRVPILGAGLRALTHRLFAFSVPEGGSGMGRAYMEVFVNGAGGHPGSPLPYVPCEQTRIPNRYYHFRYGSDRSEVNFWALDSNTLDAPAPYKHSINKVREEAARRIEQLEAKAKTLDTKLRQNQTTLDRWREEQRRALAEDPARRDLLIARLTPILEAIHDLRSALEGVTSAAAVACKARALDAVLTVEHRWKEGAADLSAARDPDAVVEALYLLEDAGDDACQALRALEVCLSALQEGSERSAILGARDEMDKRLDAWTALASPAPAELTERLRTLSEEALDVQREVALERRRLKYRPEDHDSLQLRWLEEGLARVAAERPESWRVVYLHHPPYTAIGNHCEKADVQNLRENLLPILQRHGVHLVLAGHSHAFEWFRSDVLPYTGFFVSGGGGQITLRPSIVAPGGPSRNRSRYDSLRASGAREYATGGAGPSAEDGESGMIYHYLRITVSAERLEVHPVGVRHLEGGGFRREEPMPVFHAPSLSPGRPRWIPRRLRSVSVFRDQPPLPAWESYQAS